MVTFSCDHCNDTVKKPKANQHAQRCRGSLTCIDCSKTFWSGEWNAHNACISEAEAYQGALYKPTKKELKRKAQEQAKATNVVIESPASTVVAPAEEVFPTAADLSSTVTKRQKKSKDKNQSLDAPNTDLALLASMLTTDTSISIHKAIKQMRADGKIVKTEKDLLKSICIRKSTDGTLFLI